MVSVNVDILVCKGFRPGLYSCNGSGEGVGRNHSCHLYWIRQREWNTRVPIARWISSQAQPTFSLHLAAMVLLCEWHYMLLFLSGYIHILYFMIWMVQTVDTMRGSMSRAMKSNNFLLFNGQRDNGGNEEAIKIQVCVHGSRLVHFLHHNSQFSFCLLGLWRCSSETFKCLCCSSAIPMANCSHHCHGATPSKKIYFVIIFIVHQMKSSSKQKRKWFKLKFMTSPHNILLSFRTLV